MRPLCPFGSRHLSICCSSRVLRKDTRPLLRNTDSRTALERLLKEREPVYAQADLTIESDEGPHDAVVRRILAALDVSVRPSRLEKNREPGRSSRARRPLLRNPYRQPTPGQGWRPNKRP
jgi:hypothetical protein